MLTDLIGDAAVGEFVVLGHGGPAVVDVVVVVDVGQRVADRRPRHVADVETLKDIFSGQFFFLHMVDNFSRPQQNKLNLCVFLTIVVSLGEIEVDMSKMRKATKDGLRRLGIMTQPLFWKEKLSYQNL